MRTLPLLLTSLMMVACGAKEIRDQAEESHDDRRVSGVFPSHDAMALRGDISIQVVLGEEMIGTLPNIHVIGQHDSWSPQCALDETEKWVTCKPLMDLPRNQVFDIKVGLFDDNPLAVTPTSEFPESTPGYLLNTNSNITNFGEDASTAERVGEMFRSSDIAVLIEGYNGQAGNFTLLAGPVDIQDNGKASVRAPGLTFVKDIVIDDSGSFSSTAQSVFMPIFVDTGFVQVLIQNSRVTGQIQAGEIRGLKITGDIPAISLVKLAEPLGAAANLVLGSITMDVDLDEDGEADAAFFSLVTSAPRVEMVQY
ncbi:MAG: hypothetical protein ACI8RZ_003963 [Myxococcota bacterium]|jgi:hypothetical protein